MSLENKEIKIPIFFSDETCGLCRYWVEYWKQLTGDRVEYRPLTEKNFSSVSFLETDGQMYSGAHAVARLLSYAPRKKWILWMYLRFPPFTSLSEWMYTRVSSCRACAAKFTHVLWGAHPRPSIFFLLRPLVFVLLGILILFLLLSFGFHFLKSLKPV